MKPIRHNGLHIRTRLHDTDHFRFQQLAKLFEVSETQFARQAILYYLDRVEQDQLDRIESDYSRQLKSSANRICALLSKIAMDVRAIYFFLGEDEPHTMEKWRNMARKLVNKTLTQEELDLAQRIAVRVHDAINEPDPPTTENGASG